MSGARVPAEATPALTTETYHGFQLRAFFTDGLEARIEITRDGVPFRKGTYPAYRIWNLSAHWHAMVDEYLRTPGPNA